MSKKLKIWYKLANNKFEIEKEYNKNTSKQDFIKIIKNHFRTEIKNNKLIYNGEKIDIIDIKMDWNDAIEENEDILKAQNISTIVSCITLIAGMISTTFLADKNLSLETKFYILLIVLVAFYAIYGFIYFLDVYFKNSKIYIKSFYKICLKILEEIEEEKLECIEYSLEEIKKFMGIK